MSLLCEFVGWICLVILLCAFIWWVCLVFGGVICGVLRGVCPVVKLWSMVKLWSLMMLGSMVRLRSMVKLRSMMMSHQKNNQKKTEFLLMANGMRK